MKYAIGVDFGILGSGLPVTLTVQTKESFLLPTDSGTLLKI